MEEEKDVNDYSLYYENTNRSRGYISLNRSQNVLKRPNIHFSSHKQPKQLRTSYLLDKRNQFNLAPLKGEPTSDPQENNSNYESSTLDKPTDNHGGYYWVPKNNVSDYRWTADNVRTEFTRSNDNDISNLNKNVESLQQKPIDDIHDTSMTNNTYENNTDNEKSEQLSSGSEEKSVPNDSTGSKTNEIDKFHVDIGGKYGVDKKFGGKYKRGRQGNAGYNDRIIDKVYGSAEYCNNIEDSPAHYDKLPVNYNDNKVDIATVNNSYNNKMYGSTEYHKNTENSPSIYEKLPVNYNDDKVDIATFNNNYNDRMYGSTEYHKNIENSPAHYDKLSVNYNDNKVDIATFNNSYNDKMYGSTEYHKNTENSPVDYEKLSVNYNDNKVDIATVDSSYNDKMYGSTEYHKNIENSPAHYDKLTVNYNDNKVDIATFNNSYHDKMYGSTEYHKNTENYPAAYEKLSVNYNDNKVDIATVDSSCNDKMYGSTEYHKNTENSLAHYDKLSVNYNDDKVDVRTANDSDIDKMYGSTEYHIKDSPVICENLSVNYKHDKVDVAAANDSSQSKLNTEKEFHDKTELKFGVDKKFGGKYKRKLLSSENKFDLNRPLFDTRSSINKASHRFEDYRIGGEGSKSDHKQGFRENDLGQQRSSNGSFSGEKPFNNYRGSTFMPKKNDIAHGSLPKNQVMNSKTEGKNDRLADKEQIKQILINHANKSAQKGQILSGNCTTNNDIRISNTRIPKVVDSSGNVGKPTTTAATTTTTSTSVSISNVTSTSKANIAKPLLVSSINNSVLKTPITNNVKTTRAISSLNRLINRSTPAVSIPGGLMNMNTTNVLPNVLGNANAIRNSLLLANAVLNPLFKKIPSNPVINSALQLMPGAPNHINNSLLVQQNSMRAPLHIRHPVLNNIRIPFNQRSTLLPNQNVQLNNLTNMLSRTQHFPLGRFR